MQSSNTQSFNWNKLHSLNIFSPTDGGDGSLPSQGSPTNGSADTAFATGALPQEYLINASGDVSPVSGATTQSNAGNAGPGPATSSPPAPTLVGSKNGLQFDLVWDSSVTNAPRGFMQAVIDAARTYTTLFSNKEVITIDVGYGEVAGSAMAPFALGESASFAYSTDYATVTSALSRDGFSFAAANEPAGSPIVVTSAQAKTLGMIDPNSGLDGYVGFSDLSGTGYSWNTAANRTGSNAGILSNQFDLQAVAEHEISEVMGRLGFEGFATVNGQPAYTELDLFNYQSPGVLSLSANGGYFSVDNGRINLGNFNNAATNGGDIADWASDASITQSGTLGLAPGSYDAYDAFANPGYNGQLSLSDIVEDAALGYTFKPSSVALLANYIASSFADAAGPHGDAVIDQASQTPAQQSVVSHTHA